MVSESVSCGHSFHAPIISDLPDGFQTKFRTAQIDILAFCVSDIIFPVYDPFDRRSLESYFAELSINMIAIRAKSKIYTTENSLMVEKNKFQTGICTSTLVNDEEMKIRLWNKVSTLLKLPALNFDVSTVYRFYSPDLVFTNYFGSSKSDSKTIYWHVKSGLSPVLGE